MKIPKALKNMVAISPDPDQSPSQVLGEGHTQVVDIALADALLGPPFKIPKRVANIPQKPNQSRPFHDPWEKGTMRTMLRSRWRMYCSTLRCLSSMSRSASAYLGISGTLYLHQTTLLALLLLFHAIRGNRGTFLLQMSQTSCPSCTYPPNPSLLRRNH